MDSVETVLAYHERTKHHPHRYAVALGYMDWANQPHPFRYYTGAAKTDLDLQRVPAQVAYDQLYEPNALKPSRVDLNSVADLFRYSMALSAWKQSGNSRWALRVNPSSGNLHPTEAYVLFAGQDNTASLYHYVSESHSLERRASLSQDLWRSLMRHLPAGSFLIGLSSIIWREAWKYGERAFRYCQHDTGHAVAALRLSAALCGWKLKVVATWSTDDVAALLGLDRQCEFIAEEREEAELLTVVMPNTVKLDAAAVFPPPSDKLRHELRSANWYGQANRLSRAHAPWPIIQDVTTATKMPQYEMLNVTPRELDIPRVTRAEAKGNAHQIIHGRRSCLALDGASSVSREVFLQMLARTLPGPHPPWDALYWPTAIHLVLFVHRVEGLSPGLYLLVRDPAKEESLKAAMRKTFLWQVPQGVPEGFPLYLLAEGDYRNTARAVSCDQDIAADGFFSLGMIAEYAELIQQHGAWYYRNLFWEAGIVGHVLYLEAEAASVRSTGMGCYLDDPVHEILGLENTEFQSMYHFTVGVHVNDDRLQTWPPYGKTER